MMRKWAVVYLIVFLSAFPWMTVGQENAAVTFNPEIRASACAQAPIWICEPLFVDRALAASLLMGDRVAHGRQTIRPEDPDSEGVDLWEYEDEQHDASLSVSNQGSLTYYTHQARYVEAIINPLSGVYPDVDLPFASRADAETRCIDLLKQLGIDARPYWVAALDQATLQGAYDEQAQELQELEQSGWAPYIKQSWTPEDACYFIKLRVYIGNLPIVIHDFSPIVSTWLTQGSEIWMMVDKQGVTYLEVQGCLYRGVEALEAQPLLSLDQAKDHMIRWADHFLNVPSILIDDILLEYRPNIHPGYRPDQRVEMTPAWIFVERRVMPTGHIAYREPLTINAATGEVM